MTLPRRWWSGVRGFGACLEAVTLGRVRARVAWDRFGRCAACPGRVVGRVPALGVYVWTCGAPMQPGVYNGVRTCGCGVARERTRSVLARLRGAATDPHDPRNFQPECKVWGAAERCPHDEPRWVEVTRDRAPMET